LCAVFHAAGVTRDAVLANESWDTYRETVAAKIDGAWNLHCLTEEDPVRLMVFYSSAASLLGSPGQGSYAAANAFLDALAHFRAARGLRTLSVNWGAWAAAGMAARLSPELAARWSRLGARPMPAARALASLDQAITAGSVQTAILDMDWASFAASRAGHADRALFRELLDRSSQIDRHPGSSSSPMSNRPSTTDPASPDIVASLRSAAPAERPRLLREYLKDCARKTLGLDPKAVLAEDVPLQEVGLDSLMALEMRNDLAQSLHVALPAGLLFDYPAIAQLAQELLRVLAAKAEAQPSREEPHSEQNNALDSLSEEEAEQLLMEELDRPVPEKANV
jgi:myxalamid-type polyketide synthase MxaC